MDNRQFFMVALFGLNIEDSTVLVSHFGRACE